MQLAEGSESIVFRENSSVVDRNDVAAFDFIHDGPGRGGNGTDTGGFGPGDVVDPHTLEQLIGGKFEPEGRTVARHTNGVGLFLVERGRCSVERGHGGDMRVRGKGGAMAVENTGIGREFSSQKVIHALIKAVMVIIFHTAGVIVDPDDVLGGETGFVAQKTATAGLHNIFATATEMTDNPDATTKDLDAREVSPFAGGPFVAGHSGATFGQSGILEENVMIEAERPKRDTKASTKKHGPDGGVNSLNATFHDAVFMMSSSADGDDGEIKLFLEELADPGVLVKLTALIHENVAVISGRVGRNVLGQPEAEPLDGGNLGAAGATI